MLDNLSSVTTDIWNNVVFCLLRVVNSLATDFQDLSDLTLLQLWVIYPKCHISRTVESRRQMTWSGREGQASSLLLTEIQPAFYRLEIFTSSIWLGTEL